MNKGITVLSLFDGISCGRLALEKAGIDIDSYYASEIKNTAIKCSRDNWDDITQIGDVTKVSYSDGILTTEKGIFNVGHIDLLIGGSPCQDFSNANKNITGLDGPKSRLFYHYHRILNEINPKYFLLENVKMKQDHENILNEFMGVKPIKIDSKLVSGAMRRRLYWTNIQDVLIPKDKEIKLQNILDNGYTPKDKAYCLMEGDSRPFSTPWRIFHRWFAKSFGNIVFMNKEHYINCKKHYTEHFSGMSAKKIQEDIEILNIDTSIYDGIRYINKEERCRLQTLDDNYCNCLSANEAAGVIGDGWTVDVVAHILKNIK